MNKVEAQLGRLDDFLARAPRDARSRAEIAGNLREHARTRMAARLGHGYSLELAIVDISLITAITGCETDQSEESLATLRERLREFHVAVGAHEAGELAAAA